MTAPVSVPGVLVSKEPPTAWSNPSRVYAGLAHALAVVVAVVGLLHPGFTEPRFAQTWLPAIAVLCSALLAAVHIVAGHWLDGVTARWAPVGTQILGEAKALAPIAAAVVPDADAAIRQALGLPADAKVTDEMRNILNTTTTA
jgi:hypothetical protein